MPRLSLEETVKKDWVIQGMQDRKTRKPITARAYVDHKGRERSSSLYRVYNDAPLKGPQIDVLPAPYYHTGKCPELDDWHYSTFFDVGGSSWGNAGLLYYEKQLIGSMERKGQRSVLALVNLEDSNGEVLFNMGGIYSVSMEVELAIRDADRKTYPRIFPSIDLSKVLGDRSFEVFPRRQINLWSNLPWYEFFQAKAVHDRIISTKELLEKKYCP
jgi:hypothetical protein